jgi:hypothetical protein
MLTGSTATDQSLVQILYAKDLIGAKEVVDRWTDKAGNALEVQDVQFVPGKPTVAMIVYRKLTNS